MFLGSVNFVRKTMIVSVSYVYAKLGTRFVPNGGYLANDVGTLISILTLLVLMYFSLIHGCRRIVPNHVIL